jgi:WD40 repeat protein
MSELKTRLGEKGWKALEGEASGPAFRMLTVFASLAERPEGQGWRVFRAAEAKVLAGLTGREQSADSLDERVQALNRASEVVGERPEFASLVFDMRRADGALVLEMRQAENDRMRELAMESTQAMLTTPGLAPRLQTPQGVQKEPTYLVAVSRGPAGGAAAEVTDEFLTALEEKLTALAVVQRRGYRVRLWWPPRDLAAAGAEASAQSRAAANRADALLVMMSDGWPDPEAFGLEAGAFHQDGELAHEFCPKVIAAGDQARFPAPYRHWPAQPLLWSQNAGRRWDGKPFASLLQLRDKGDRDDRDCLVGQVCDELLAVLDRAHAQGPRPDPAVAASEAAKRTFGEATHESFGREVPKHVEKARATQAEGQGEPEDLLPLLQAWVDGEGARSRIFALLGSFGTGKTTVAHMFAEQLVEAREKDPAAPFPILLDLKRLSEFFGDQDPAKTSLTELMVRSLNPEQAREIDPVGLLKLLRSEPCVIIFDGLDEVGTRLGVERTTRLYGQLLDIVPKAVWNQEAAAGEADWSLCGARIMVTCRTQFFETYVQQKTVLTGHHRHTAGPIVEGDAHTTTYYMAPFEPEQVRSYFEVTLGAARGREIYESIAGVGDLQALVSKPLMTRYIAELAPQLLEDIARGRKINAGVVYQRLFEQALERDGFKRTVMTVRDRQELLEVLAEVFWLRRRPVLKLRDLEKWFDGYMHRSESLGNILKSGTEARALLQTELRNASLLMRQAEDEFAFDHTSFYEYFLARRLIALVLEGGLDSMTDCPPVSAECLRFLRDHIEADELAEDLGRGLDRLFLKGTVAARGLGVRIVAQLQALKPAWNYPVGADLSGLDLKQARSAGTGAGRRLFRQVSFAGSNLLGAEFNQADFQDCDFDGTVLAGARFEACAFDRCHGAPREAASARTFGCRIDPETRRGVLQALILAFPSAESGGRRRPPRAGYHTAGFNSAVFSPDGLQVLIASLDNTARLFDRASGAEIARFTGHDDWVQSAVFSPDGAQVLTASHDRTARLFDRGSGAEIARFTGHEDWVRSAVFSPDGAQVLTASGDSTARLFDRASEAEIARFTGHDGTVQSAVFSPDGALVLTASYDGTARLFDRASGAEIARFTGHDDWVQSAVFSPDGAQVLTASSDRTARLFDRASGAEIARFTGHEDWVRSAVFSPDGAQVLTASDDRTARLFDRASGAEIARFTGHEGWVLSAVFSPDGAQVLTASYDRTARLFDRASGAEIARFTGHENWVLSAVFTPDGAQVLTASFDRTARLFDRASGAEIARFTGHENIVRSAVFSPDGAQVLTASSDNTARLFDRASGARLGGWQPLPEGWMLFDGDEVAVSGGGGWWKYVHGVDTSDPLHPKVVCPDLPQLSGRAPTAPPLGR